MVRKVEGNPHEKEAEYVTDVEDMKKGYTWFEMGIFTRWDDGGKCKVLCVDTPNDLPEKLKAALEKRPSYLNFGDPFAMHTDLLDQIIVYYDISVWRVRDPVREREKVSVQLMDDKFTGRRVDEVGLRSRPGSASERMNSSLCAKRRGTLSTPLRSWQRRLRQ
jgi:hypothetical protein